MSASPERHLSPPVPDPIAARLDAISHQLDRLVARQEAFDQQIAGLAPLGRVALDGAIETLDELERDGWFAFAREARRIAERVVRAYSPADVARLGDQIVGILDTVRNLTQPDVLALVNEATAALHDAEDADPKGAWGLVRASKDPDVRKGIGVLVAVLKQVGRAAEHLGTMSAGATPVRIAEGAERADDVRPSWTSRIAPRRARASASALDAGAPAAPPARAAETSAPSMPAGYGPDGFLRDPASWTRALAIEVAALVPLALSDEHWKVIDWARAEHGTSGASPNIRRLSLGTGVAVRDLYALFPRKPGVLIAMLAGIPKPTGCI